MCAKQRDARKNVPKKIKYDKKIKSIQDVCRTCLSTVDLVSIFYNKETEEKRTEDLKMLTGLEDSKCECREEIIEHDTKETATTHKKYEPHCIPGFEYGLYNHEIHNDHDYIKIKTDGLKDKLEKFQKSKKPTPTIITERGTYKCHICEKEYKNKCTLRSHINFHTNFCVCEICGNRFLNNHLLVAHKRAKHGLERIHYCAYCEYNSATKDALVIHERTHTGERPYVCDHCGIAFHRRSNLVQHIAIHLPEEKFQCTICHKRVKSKRLLQHHHFKVHKEKRYRYTCPVCQDVFRSPGSVRIHLTRSHGVPREDQGVIEKFEIKMDDGLSQKICTKCLETMNEALQFRRSSRKAEKALLNMLSGKPKRKYSTRLQKKIFKKSKLKKSKLESPEDDYGSDIYDNDFQNDDYQNNYNDDSQNDVNADFNGLIKNGNKSKFKQKQTGPKKRGMIPNAASYKCATCNKEFRMKATYKAHMRFHTNYCVCESCGKRCRNNNQLQEHKRARHGLGRIHKCAYCEYSSATKEALTIHERRHTGERPYVCDHCGATFHRRSNLVQHIAIHLPEKNFQCDMCPKRLKSRKFLQIHKHNAHTGRRYGYLCAVCGHRFEKPNKVRAHTRRVHGLPDDQQGPIVRVQL
ncbi:uncharacterized protein ACR2FA_007319 [Aphomia sociella]